MTPAKIGNYQPTEEKRLLRRYVLMKRNTRNHLIETFGRPLIMERNGERTQKYCRKRCKAQIHVCKFEGHFSNTIKQVHRMTKIPNTTRTKDSTTKRGIKVPPSGLLAHRCLLNEKKTRKVKPRMG